MIEKIDNDIFKTFLDISLKKNKKSNKLAKPNAIFFDWENTIVTKKIKMIEIKEEANQIVDKKANTNIANNFCKNNFYDYFDGKQIDNKMNDLYKKIFNNENIFNHIEHDICYDKKVNSEINSNIEENKKNKINHKKKYKSEYIYDFIEKNPLIKLLDLIKKNKIFCGVISNKNNIVLNKQIKEFDLAKYFSIIIGDGDSPSRKPMVDPMIYALSKTNIEFGKNIWFIGDSYTDIEFANITISTAILYDFNKTKKNNENFNYYKEDLIIYSMEELFQTLNQIFEK
jgi:phosphoglycolate phosphatase-like HAD superfamily hydrolase